MENYIPNRGDVVWLDFTPQAGHEQAGRRPALVLTPMNSNERSKLMLCCPLTTKIKGYPFEVEIIGEKKQVALSDQIKSLDWSSRNIAFIMEASEEEVEEVLGKLFTLLD